MEFAAVLTLDASATTLLLEARDDGEFGVRKMQKLVDGLSLAVATWGNVGCNGGFNRFSL